MPSIYPQLKKSDRKFIAREKGRIRAHFSDTKKQAEMITELYKRFVGKSLMVPQEAKSEIKPAAKPKKVAAKKTPKK